MRTFHAMPCAFALVRGLVVVCGAWLLSIHPAPAGAAVPVAHPDTAAAVADIRFDAAEYSFGEAWAGDKVDAVFHFSNQGAGALEIFYVKPGCGCTQAGEWDRRVGPGKRGRIPLRLNTAGLSGFIKRKVTVTSNSPKNPNVTLTIQGQVNPLADLDPPELVFGRLDPGQLPAAQKATATFHLPAPVRTARTACTLSGFAARTREIKRGQAFEIEVTTPAALAPGAYAGVVRLELAEPSGRSLTVPVSAWVPSAVEVQPDRLQVPAGPLPADLERTLTVRGAGSQALTITDLATNLPETQINCADGPSPQSQKIMVRFKRGCRLSPRQSWWIDVTFGDSRLGRLRIPVSAQAAGAPAEP
ncbi:MAG: DUF1573 domain-containing protein [candidate division FCPU426 bacterium]